MENKNNFQQEVEVKQTKTKKPQKYVPLPFKLLYWIFVGWWWPIIAFFGVYGDGSPQNEEKASKNHEFMFGWTRRFYLVGKKYKKSKAEFLNKSQNKLL